MNTALKQREPTTTTTTAAAAAAAQSPVTVDAVAGAWPIDTVGELIERLSLLPPQSRVLVNGHEGGFSGLASATIVDVQELDGTPSYMGRFASLEHAALDLDSRGIRGWRYRSYGQPPTPVGEPITAIVLGRE